MKKVIMMFLIVCSFLVCLFSVAHAESKLPAVYINNTRIDNYNKFIFYDNSVYVSAERLAEIFNFTLSTDSDKIAYTFSGKMRNITYDANTGTVSVLDRHSLSYRVSEKNYPCKRLKNEVYIPLKMICYAIDAQITYDSYLNRIYIIRSGSETGFFNSEGRAIAYANSKYGIVDSDGNIILNFRYDDITNFENPEIFKITYRHKCGLADIRGNILLDIIYNEIEYKSPSEIYLEKDSLMGMCDITGKLTIPVMYEDIVYCGNQIAMVQLGKKWGILNCKTGQLSNLVYDSVYRVTNGVQTDNAMIQGYYAEKDGKWGFIDSFGNTMIDFQYDALDKFDLYGRARVIYQNKFGIINCGGEIIVPTAYDYIYSFGTLNVTVAQVGKLYGAIDTKGNAVIPFEYNYLYSFDDKPYTVAYKDNKFGIIGTDGSALTEFDYSYIEDFKNGVALAYRNGYGYINSIGDEVIPCIHEEVKQGTAASVFLKKENTWALFSPNGNNLTGYIYESANDFSNGLSAVSRTENGVEKFGYVNDSGDLIIPLCYDSALPFKYGKAIVSKNGLYGIIDVEGNTVIPFEYTGFNPSYDYNVIAAANGRSKWGLISFANKKLADFKYDYIFEFSDGYAAVLLNNQYGIINTNGKIVISPSCQTQAEAVTALSKLTHP